MLYNIKRLRYFPHLIYRSRRRTDHKKGTRKTKNLITKIKNWKSKRFLKNPLSKRKLYL